MDLILIGILHRERSDRMQIYMHICTNAHTYIYTRTVHPSLPTYVHICTHTHTYMYIHIHTYIYIGLASAIMVSLRSDRKDWNIRLKQGDF